MHIYKMYVITVLTLENNEVKVYDVYNDEMTARDKFIKLAVDLSRTEDKFKAYEAVHTNLTEVHIYRKSIGYITTYKELYKILLIHEMSSYDVKEI